MQAAKQIAMQADFQGQGTISQIPGQLSAHMPAWA